MQLANFTKEQRQFNEERIAFTQMVEELDIQMKNKRTKNNQKT